MYLNCLNIGLAYSIHGFDWNTDADELIKIFILGGFVNHNFLAKKGKNKMKNNLRPKRIELERNNFDES